ncbi:MAG: DUF1802 family protein [Candidatus Pristimantibacillus lignocellulolyticus]|uniref:DUF1802 family protein n=1 Tax=Candidatus Pristimantibacillus lignocellulolyticus TaxID=2994561 RepID=A0A9J6ZEQ7_9BACL|nr:MAG: DUF1802 family protein [Candidatus Pristimantibacillus lignocellulolyticus]
MPTENKAIALKEWAVTVGALLQGELIFVMRKGGIVEETRDFELLSPQFYLMPAYEHQKEHLLKEPFQGRIAATMTDWTPTQSHMKLEGYAKVVEDIEITSENQLQALRDLHIWTDEFATERLKWKKKNPLHLLIMRVYRLESPVMPPMRVPYTGCKSWVRIEDELTESNLVPVLTDEVFEQKYNEIKLALEEVVQ